jgi:hypothetical protein
LPAPIGDFVGRRTELALLDRLLAGPTGDRRSGPLVVISGIGGIGKTTLALRVAQRVRSRYPDGILLADLRAFGALAAADPYEVLGVQLRSLGVTAPTLPSDADERVALFRSITASRRLLVLLDDAVDEAQVRPLIPGGEGCAVVVTSRLALTGLDRAVHLALCPRPGGDAPEPLAVGQRSEYGVLVHDERGADPGDGDRLVGLTIVRRRVAGLGDGEQAERGDAGGDQQ